MPVLPTIADFALPALRGEALNLADYAGRPVLVVNTASLCGFTAQYAGLQSLYDRYRTKGLVVIAVPSNDFGKQEPGDTDSIATLCDARFHITFPVAAKAAVSGTAAIPLFRWLADQAGVMGRPRWNFYKYLIGRDGQLATWFGSITRPEAPKLCRAIERCLAQ